MMSYILHNVTNYIVQNTMYRYMWATPYPLLVPHYKPDPASCFFPEILHLLLTAAANHTL